MEKKIKKYYHENYSEPVFFYEEKTMLEWKKSSNRENFFLIKDNFWTKNLPTTASSNFLKDFFPLSDSTVVKFLIEQGYSNLGKTYLDEFACGGSGLFSSEGKISNPNDKERITGGSSSGSAFAVAKDIVSFSIGHDAGDSIRRPSSYCGVIGFKPSYGSISRYGVIPMASSFDTVGIISKKIEIIRKIFSIISKPDFKDMTTVAFEMIEKPKIKKKQKIKVVVIEGIEKLLTEKYSLIYKNLLQKISEDKNFEIKEIKIPEKIRENLQISYLILCSSELFSHLNSLKGITYGTNENPNLTIKEKRSSKIGKWVKERIVIGSYFLKEKKMIEKANNFRLFVTEWIKKVFEKNEFLIFPGTEGIAPKIKEIENNENIKKTNWFDNLLLLANFAGNPSINIPIGKINKMPVSINIDSFWKNELSLFEFSEIIIEKVKKI